ncbi:MAG: hypothetical protein IIY06_06505 [Proteobacteria bacterium]|jgi:hypothetical protein|nr:hypothetical protein [Pseudomonadota bacterium]
MAFDQKRCERLARATASDIQVYNKDKIVAALEQDNFFEALKDSLEESKKNFEARSKEAAQTNILERAIVDTIIVQMGVERKYSIF